MRRVLIIDDDDDIREVAKLSLEVTGEWDVATAPDGETGARMAAEQVPDVILLDYMMPGLDGAATLARLQGDARTREVPVLMLTARVAATLEKEMMAQGAKGVLAKPFDPLSLGHEIVRRLGWS